MNLKERLQADVATAMRSGDTARRDTLRLLLAAVKQEEVDRLTTLDDEGVEAVIKRQAKQRRETIADAQKAGRAAMVADAEAELAIVQEYLPAMMGEEEIRAIAEVVVAETGAEGIGDMGRVMSRLMPRLKDKADGRLINEVVRELLQR